jgi:hypothetical protein
MVERKYGRSPTLRAIPKGYDEAIQSPEKELWKQAMVEELTSIFAHEVFEFAVLPPGRKAIGPRWVFDLRRDEKGNIVRYKARLTGQGFRQREGIDYSETFAPTVRLDTVRIVLALACYYDLELRQLDIKTAFLHGILPEDEVVYMRVPQGVEAPAPGMVCKLKKTLYGLKQASRAWNEALDPVLLGAGLAKSLVDPCLYYHVADGGRSLTLVSVHVDDIVMASNNCEFVEGVIVTLRSHFTVNDLGECKFVLGLKISRVRSQRELRVTQGRYINDIVNRFRMQDSYPQSTPADVKTKLSRAFCPKTEEERSAMAKIPYRQLIGCLMYAATTIRYDIAVETHILSRAVADPGKAHWEAGKRVVRYLKTMPERGLHYRAQYKRTQSGPPSVGKGPRPSLIAFADSDFATDPDTRRSVSGWAIFLGGMLVAWHAKQQEQTATSTPEAEWYAACSAAQQVLWTQSLLTELNQEAEEPVKIYEDNNSCIQFGRNPIHSSRMKHIDVKYFFLRELIQKKKVELLPVRSEFNVADFFTKVLLPGARESHISYMEGRLENSERPLLC